MNRDRLEIGWYAIRPFLYYIVLFITIRAVLYHAAESLLLFVSADMAVYYEMWSDIVDIMILGIASAGAAVPILREGRREILLTQRRSSRAWITKQKDSKFLISILPFGTICLAAFLNLMLAKRPDGVSVSLRPEVLPLGAAVYGFLTPFVEELLYRGIVWHRLRRGFSSLEAALLSALLFGAAHGNIPQAVYGFAMGLVFAWSYEFTRRFEVPYLLHCTCNLTVLAASSAGWNDVLDSPMWLLFFAVGSLLAFGYWGYRIYDKL